MSTTVLRPSVARVPRILCPTDFSEPASIALRCAVAYVGRYGGEITTLLVLERRSGPFEDATPAALARVLKEFARPVEDAGVALRTEIRPGRAGPAILSFAREMSCDLIVLGTQALHRRSEFLAGSVASSLIHASPVPVLTVPFAASGRVARDELPGTIVCPVDLSPGSAAGLDAAARVASTSGARLVVLSVLDAFTRDLPVGVRPFHVTEFRQRIQRATRKRLAELLALVETGPRTAELQVECGRAATTILEVTAARNAGLIVMGLGECSAASRMLFGSRGEQVTRGAACPVLTVRSPLAT